MLKTILRRYCSSESFTQQQIKQKVSIQRATRSKQKFVDRIKVRVVAGTGGNGCVSHFHIAPGKKRPDGGHGGAGGHVYVRADEGVKSLAKTTHHFKAGHGVHGLPNDKYGRRGKDCIITVPAGTVIKRIEREERYKDDDEEDFEIVDHLTVVADLDEPGSEICLAAGGPPGLGNRILTGKTTKYGRLQKKMPLGKNEGQKGETGFFEFELKSIADIGLVGYPNAGKSTLTGAISRAEPKIAPYPFTTLHPHIGMVEFPDSFQMSVADLPGLIEGAHENVGLGHDFLRHIERTKILCYVLDTAGTENRDPVEDFRHLQRELELYATGLTSRPSLIVANKMDHDGAGENLARLREATDLAVLPISASHEIDIPLVVNTMRWMVETVVKS